MSTSAVLCTFQEIIVGPEDRCILIGLLRWTGWSKGWGLDELDQAKGSLFIQILKNSIGFPYVFPLNFHPSHPFNRSENPFFCPVAHVKPRKVAVERMPSGRVQSSQREKPLYSIPARIEVGTSRCYFFWWEECFKLVRNHQGWGVFRGGMLGLRKVKAGDLCPKQFLVCNKKTVLYSDGQKSNNIL